MSEVKDTSVLFEILEWHQQPPTTFESPGEIELARILESGPGTGARSGFARAGNWREAFKAVAADTTALARNRLIIFPQTPVLAYRTDFLVVCANVARVMKRSALSLFGFFVECDGVIGHAENAEQVRADLNRERSIRRETGLDMLRFSGAEVMYQPEEVRSVIAAQVEAMAAEREFGDQVRAEATEVRRLVGYLSMHRMLRTDYTRSNARRSQQEVYDETDPLGEFGIDEKILDGASMDEFLRLRVALARLSYAVGRARQDDPTLLDDHPFEGGLRPFNDALNGAIEFAFARFSNGVTPGA